MKTKGKVEQGKGTADHLMPLGFLFILKIFPFLAVSLAKSVLKAEKSFRISYARSFAKLKAAIAAYPPIESRVRVFDDRKLGPRLRPMVKAKDLDDGDVQASTHDYVGASVEVQCDLGTESLRAIHKSQQWPELNSHTTSTNSLYTTISKTR